MVSWLANGIALDRKSCPYGEPLLGLALPNSILRTGLAIELSILA